MEATLEAKPQPVSKKERLYTAKDLFNHPEWGNCELIRGKVVPVCLPKHPHAILSVELSRQLANFAIAGKLGQVGNEAGIFLEQDPDTVRGPDVYFISSARKPKKGSSGYLEVPPELCVEIVSPKDRWSKLEEKVDMYLSFGVKIVWVIDPKTQKAHIYRGNKVVEIVDANGELSGEEFLPGFKLPLKDLFAVLD